MIYIKIRDADSVFFIHSLGKVEEFSTSAEHI